MSLGKLAAPPA